jgi:adenine phosphoribosyltransferase
MALEDDIKRAIRDVPDFPKPGIVFKDITPIFYDQPLCNAVAEGFIDRLGGRPDAVVGIESRGFLFGFMVANRLGVPFILARKAGKLPHVTVSEEYALEYGSAKLEMHADALRPGWKVIIHDDLLATGGTAAATASLVRRAGAEICGFNFLAGLEFLQGRKKLIPHSHHITCLVHY